MGGEFDFKRLRTINGFECVVELFLIDKINRRGGRREIH